uniref:Uncharacterized protein n=1 Tax=Kalanchoe fedtschenkoi TaxID=63787 RepID=A0A7N0VJT8_KALFE
MKRDELEELRGGGGGGGGAILGRLRIFGGFLGKQKLTCELQARSTESSLIALTQRESGLFDVLLLNLESLLQHVKRSHYLAELGNQEFSFGGLLNGNKIND